MRKSIKEHIDHELARTEQISQAILQAMRGYVTPFHELPSDMEFGVHDPEGLIPDSVYSIGNVRFAAGSQRLEDIHVEDQPTKRRFTFTPDNLGVIVPAVLIQDR